MVPFLTLLAAMLADGSSRRAFHGTHRVFRKFVRSRGPAPSAVGIWFTEDPLVARWFAEQSGRRFADATPSVVVADISLERPKVYETYSDFVRDWSEVYDHDAEKMRRSLSRRGYDGIVVTRSTTDVPGETERVDLAVFSTSQIVSTRFVPAADVTAP